MALEKSMLALATAVLIAGCSGSQASAKPATDNDAAPVQVSKLKIDDVKQGTGAAATKGDLVEVTYTGKLANGTVFDSTKKEGGAPFSFILGNGSVIQGWDQGVVGMKVGGERKLSIPYQLAYGAGGRGPIPPKADLFFDIKLLALVKPKDLDTLLILKDQPGKGPAVKVGDNVEIDYSVSLVNGTVVDSTKNYNGAPYRFKVGNGDVIAALDKAVVGMQAGGTRVIRVPPAIGIGSRVTKLVPMNSILDITIKVVKVGGTGSKGFVP